MNSLFKNTILRSTGAESFFETEKIQDLWSGYGSIVRYGLKGSAASSIVVKHVRLPEHGIHPRGWNTDISHNRKIRSYEVETFFYQTFARICDSRCRIPRCLAVEESGGEVLIVLEDLDAAGFGERRHSVTWNEMQSCLRWLAHFHAAFLHEKPEGLWPVGTYWHLETRPEELTALDDAELRRKAPLIDKTLNDARFRTFVHGDAKLANFCFSADGADVAAVDFQYVGGGCGIKDVAYFAGSCLYDDQCGRWENKILDYYFRILNEALISYGKQSDADAIEREWRYLYPLAWADFHRFLKGWSPGHWKLNSYSERVCRKVLANLPDTAV